METDTSILCDEHPAEVNVVEPLFTNFGGIASFSGQVVTIKCFEDNGLLYEVLEKDGCGKVLVVDGGGSLRRALVDADIIELAVRHDWEGLIIYGSVRHVDYLAEAEIGIQAIAAIPAKADHKGEGQIDIGVSFGGVTFYTGDYVYADNTGILSSEVFLQINE